MNHCVQLWTRTHSQSAEQQFPAIDSVLLLSAECAALFCFGHRNVHSTKNCCSSSSYELIKITHFDSFYDSTAQKDIFITSATMNLRL